MLIYKHNPGKNGGTFPLVAFDFGSQVLLADQAKIVQSAMKTLAETMLIAAEFVPEATAVGGYWREQGERGHTIKAGG